jgi:hypothetical protein
MPKNRMSCKLLERYYSSPQRGEESGAKRHGEIAANPVVPRDNGEATR